MNDYATRKRELWRRIQAESPGLAADLVALRDFDYQLFHVELHGEVAWHIEDPSTSAEPLKRMSAVEWQSITRDWRSGPRDA